MTLHFDTDGRDWPNRASSRFVDVRSIRWHVQQMGTGPVILLLHGTGAATHSWRDVAPILARDFTVVAPDLPGHGFTRGRPLGGLSMPAMARSVGDLVEALELKPALVVGHSAGAAIGIRTLLDGRCTAAGFVGLNPALLPFPGIAAKLFPTMAKLLFVNPFAPHVFAQIARGPGEVGRFLTRSTGSRIDARGVDCYTALFRDPGHIGGAIGMMADWDLDSFAALLPGLATPLLLIHGADDTAIPAKAATDAAAMVPGARVEVIDGVGHLAHEEQPESIAARIAAFHQEVSR